MGSMKDLMICVDPAGKFNDELGILVKLQIDNSLELGWKREDITLVTNFDYEYRGVKSLVVPDNLYYEPDYASTKMLVIDYLLTSKLLPEDLYWYHDFDAYENVHITEEELYYLYGCIGLTSYVYKPEWNCGSFFFEALPLSRYLFDMIVKQMQRRVRPRSDEKSLTHLTYWNKIDREDYIHMNPTYNVSMKNAQYIASKASKPLKVLHFHPYGRDWIVKEPLLVTFKRMMSPRLLNLFGQYGF